MSGTTNFQAPESKGGRKVQRLSPAAWESLEDRVAPSLSEVDGLEDALRAEIGKLDPPLREVVEGYFYERLTEQAIGDMLGISQPAVAKRLKKALGLLRLSVSADLRNAENGHALDPYAVQEESAIETLRGGIGDFYDESGTLLPAAREAIDVLPVDERVMVQGYLVSQMTDAELAQRTGKSESAVKTLKSAGLDALRALLTVKAVFPEATAVESAAS